MTIFDSHAHYDDEAFNEDREYILGDVRDSGIGYIVNAGANMESSRLSVELAHKFDFIYAAVGIHPQDAGEFKDSSLKVLRDLCRQERVVAVGEIGLDYYYDNYDKNVQMRALEEQIKLAIEMNLPVIIHDRDAHSDTFETIKKYVKDGLRGVMHCYSGSVEMARDYVNIGFYIGFTGVITFKNAVKSIEVLKEVPADRILIETDCPYLAPVPFRGKRNDSRYLKHVVEKCCEVLNVEHDYFVEKTCSNAKELFGIK